MAFYAFSPLGGGYLSKPIKKLKAPPKGTRMDEMSVFKQIYVSDTSLQQLPKLLQACAKYGIAAKEAKLRWFMHHSALGAEDGVSWERRVRSKLRKIVRRARVGRCRRMCYRGLPRCGLQSKKGRSRITLRWY